MDNSAKHWSQLVLIAALIAVIVESILVGIVTLFQPPFPSPPVGTTPFFILIATYGAFSLPLVIWGRIVGYIGALLTGIFTLAVLYYILSGAAGSSQEGVNPLGPLTLGLFALTTIILSILGWKKEVEN